MVKETRCKVAAPFIRLGKKITNPIYRFGNKTAPSISKYAGMASTAMGIAGVGVAATSVGIPLAGIFESAAAERHLPPLHCRRRHRARRLYIGAMEPGAAMGGYGVVIEGSLVTNTTAAGLSVFDKAAHGPPVVVRDTSFVHAGPSKLSRPGLCRSNQHQQPNPLQPAPPTNPKRLLLTPSCNAL